MVFTIGDTHGTTKLYRVLHDFLQQDKLVHHYELAEKGKSSKYPVGCLQGSTFIHVGDVGIGFDWEHELTMLKRINTLLEANQCKLYAIRGNHDDPSFFNGIIQRDVHCLANIFLVSDYSIIDIEDKAFLFIGGATSVDRDLYEDGQGWWKDEQIDYLDTQDLLKSIADKTNTVDVVITHTAPNNTFPFTTPNFKKYAWSKDGIAILSDELAPTITTDCARERSYLRNLYEMLLLHDHPLTHWCYGHFHEKYDDVIGRTKFRCCAIETINQLM